MKWILCFSLLLLGETNRLFCQSAESEFGLKLAPDGCSKEFSAYNNSLIVLGNSYKIEGNKIILRYHDLQLLKTIFKDTNDGIAIDVLQKDQFTCGQENNLHTSKIFDGTLLKPVYRDALFASNTAKGNYRFIGEIGTLPKELIGSELVFSVLIINDGMVCKYLLPAPFTVRDYSLQPVPFRFENTDTVKLRSVGITSSEIVRYSFATSKISTSKIPVVTGKGKIHSIQIKAFSSIDGEEQNNAFLDSSRAEFISRDLLNRLKIDRKVISKEHGENWNLANYQFRYFGMDSLLSKKKQDVRKLVNDRRLTEIALDSLLKEQRVCEARIYYEGSFNSGSDSVALLKGNLLLAAVTENVQLFNKAAFLLYCFRGSNTIVYDKVVVEFALRNEEIVAAYAALLAKDISKNQQVITRFLSEWSQRFDVLSEAGKENLVNLYCLFNSDLLKEWDVASSRMSRVIRPETISRQTKNIGDKELQLNLQLTFIKYYGQINDTKNAEQCFYFISKYFNGLGLKVESAVQLAAFYNSWGAFQQAVDLLDDYYIINQLNEDGIFLYAENLMLLQKKGLEKVDAISLQSALRMNIGRWCKWMNDYNQNLRNPEIKRMYCASCLE